MKQNLIINTDKKAEQKLGNNILVTTTFIFIDAEITGIFAMYINSAHTVVRFEFNR